MSNATARVSGPVTTGEASSADGTTIAYSQWGQGPPLILIDGALCTRSLGPTPKLAPLLARDFTVLAYDRRGRGGSGDSGAYAVERELEDLEAMIDIAGGSASLFGSSSGAALALEAAKTHAGIEKLVIYEAPFIVDSSRPPITDETLAEFDRLVAADRRDDAVKLFLRQVGVPSLLLSVMRWTPVWPKLRTVAPTLPHDMAIVQAHQRGRPLEIEEFSTVTVPTLILVGGKSPAWMRRGMRALAGALSTARLRTLDGQTHMIKAPVVAPVVTEFLSAAI